MLVEDIKAVYVVHCPGGVDVKVLFDNASARSQRQRAYVRCLCDDHLACYRYRTVDLEASPEHAAAYCALWAIEPLTQEGEYSKAMHKQFQPCADEVNALVGSVEQV